MKNKPVILDPKYKKDFRTKNQFPGTEGNNFDKILRNLNRINQINPLLFILLMISLSGIATNFNKNNWILLFAFIVIDYLIIYLLPFLKISFGPVNSQVFLLFLLRSIFIWLPDPINIFFEMIGVILVIIGFVVEPSSIIVTKNILYSHKIHDKGEIKFVQMGDIHLEKLGIRESKLVTMIGKINPQFVLFTGDFLNLSNNQNLETMDQVIALFNKISAISPIYFVCGSPAVDLEKTIGYIEPAIIAKHLNNQIELLEVNNHKVNIIGINCTHNPYIDYKNLLNINIPSEPYNILMYHSPDLIFEITKEQNIDLMISGHTHGGQVQLPIFGAIFTGSLYGRKLQNGLYKLNETLLYITRGIGLEGMGAPRVRFLCRPEIIEWNIRKKVEIK